MTNKKIQDYLAFSVLAWLFFITACNTKTDVCKNAKELVTITQGQINEISVSTFMSEYLGSEKDYLLIDVRQITEFEDGNIEGAVNLPRGIIEFKINNPEFWEEQMMYPPSDTTEILIYCKKGSRGVLTAASIQELGYKNVKNLTGGYLAYQEKHQDAEDE